MKKRILLLGLIMPLAILMLRAQSDDCPGIVGMVVDNVEVDGNSCNYTLEIDTDVALGSSASASVYVIFTNINTNAILWEGCVKIQNNGNNPPELIEDLILPCDLNIETEVAVSYIGYNNAGCGGPIVGQSNGGACSTATTPVPLEELGILNPLPVELTFFRAHEEAFHQVKLEWVTTSEENNAVFFVERSVDARNYQKIAEITGNGTTSSQQYYSLKDKFPERGVNYYRLKQVDFDGSFSYSEVISVEIDKQIEKPLFISNSLTNSEITLQFNGEIKENTTLEIFHTSGVLMQQLEIGPETNLLIIEVASFEPGMYFIRVPIDREYQIERFMKIDR